MMPFNQFKLDRSSVQTRGIFNKYVYETDDPIDEVRTLGYFSQSRFKSLDSDATNSMGWANGFMDIICQGSYYYAQISGDGDSVKIISEVSGLITQDTFSGPGTFEANPGDLYEIDSSGGPVTVTISSTFEAGDCFGIEDVTLNFSLNNVTVDFGTYNFYSQASQTYVGNQDGETPIFCLRPGSIGFVIGG